MQKHQKMVTRQRNVCAGEELKGNYKTLYLKKRYWRPKSRIQWLKQGDNNTRFFNNFANGRKMKF